MQILPITPAPQDLDPVLQPISLAQRRLWRVAAAIKSLFILAAAWWLGRAISAFAILAAAFEAENPGTNLPDLWLPFGAFIGLVILWRLYAILWVPGRQYRSWAYAVANGELHVRRGIWTVAHTIVPLRNIQHVDTSQGPLERRFGLSQLVVHTAGVGTANVRLIGLPTELAMRLRDDIRAAAAAPAHA